MTAFGDVRANAEERQFVDERREADIARHVDASGAVVVEDVAKQVRVAVKEVLAGVGVAEVFALLGAEQRMGEPLDRLQPGRVVSPAHVERQLLAGLDRRAACVDAARQRGRHRAPRQRHPADGGRARERQPAGHRRSHVDDQLPTVV